MPQRKKQKKSQEMPKKKSSEKTSEKKKEKTNEIFLEIKPEKISADKCESPVKIDLGKQIAEAVKGLYYVSETDAEILPFVGAKSQTVSVEEILIQTKNESNAAIEERNFADFFARLTEIQDWFGDEEKQTAAKYTVLKNLLEKNLRELKVFKIGKIELDVYVVGLDAENILTGIRTKAVET